MLRLVVGLLFVTAVLAKGGGGRGTQYAAPSIVAAVTSALAAATSAVTAATPAVTAATPAAAADTSTVAADTTTETASANATAASIDYASLTLTGYLETHPTPGVMKLSSGAPIKRRDAYVSINRNLLLQEHLMEDLSHIVAETIPARVIHEKGTGAGGYFEVTHDITDICRAKMFSEIGKQTPVRLRFSSSIQFSDTIRDTRGFAVKFYTEDGNFDIVGFNTPVLFFSDPLKFSGVVHSFKANPKTGTTDLNSLLDYIILNEEVLLIMTMSFTDTGTPASYGTMPGFSQHAYQMSNANNDIRFARFSFLPYNETKLTATQAATIAGQDPDYLTRDLYNSIEAGNYPEWLVGIQVLTLEEIINDPKLINIDRYLPEDQYPVRPVGKLVLNKNANNWFGEIGQLQFLPSNLVPGIQAPPDKAFQSRAYAYRLAGNHRLGVNFNKIPVNMPLTPPSTYNKDGPPPVLDNEGDAPIYFPNSFNGPQPIDDDEPEPVSIEQVPAYNRDQVDEYYRNLPEDQKATLIQNWAVVASRSAEVMQQRFVALVTEINEDYGTRLAAGIASVAAAAAAAASQ